jgi:hypothetical protein
MSFRKRVGPRSRAREASTRLPRRREASAMNEFSEARRRPFARLLRGKEAIVMNEIAGRRVGARSQVY